LRRPASGLSGVGRVGRQTAARRFNLRVGRAMTARPHLCGWCGIFRDVKANHRARYTLHNALVAARKSSRREKQSQRHSAKPTDQHRAPELDTRGRESDLFPIRKLNRGEPRSITRYRRHAQPPLQPKRRKPAAINFSFGVMYNSNLGQAAQSTTASIKVRA
jgi:hypothetical protein